MIPTLTYFTATMTKNLAIRSWSLELPPSWSLAKYAAPKVSVGVSVSGGLLDLNISTDDISSQELLDILKSYQLKKKILQAEKRRIVNLQEQTR